MKRTASVPENTGLDAGAMLEGLSSIKVPKTSDVLADRLRREILTDAYPPGASLPTERELVTATGLSRGSVREALRILETQGLVRTRAGRYGGTTVSQPTDDHLAGHINVYAKGRSVPLSALVEVRLALEPMVASLAAERRTDEDLTKLRTIAARLDSLAETDLNGFLAANADWHDALAAASHNELLCAFATSVRELMFEASRIENFASEEVRRRVQHAHGRILEAIEAGDGNLARKRAEKDIQAYATTLGALLVTSSGGAAEQIVADG